MIALAPALPGDGEKLARLHALAFPQGERWAADAIALQLGMPGAFGWRAAEAGLVLARVAADEAEILTLGVVPACRRQGVGSALLRIALASAGLRGAKTMFLEVAAANGPARSLYAGLGFVEVGRRRDYYRPGADALLLRAPIACESTGG